MQNTLSQRYLTAKRMLFEKAYESLNPRQQEAVFHVNGPLLILAGAGSGKTTVLVRRIAFLIRYGNAYFSERIPQNLTEDRVRRLENAADTLTKNLEVNGDTEIRMGLETMGKINQLGTLDEVLTLCKLAPIYHPVIDFGHMNARNLGGYFSDVDSYRAIFDKIATTLGDDYAYNLHCHFSKIEFTNSGEKKHLTFADSVYGPCFEPLAEAIVREGVSPRIICESAGTQAEDAKFMKTTYQAALATT